ncbi:MAG: YbhN family protein [Vicinamibacteraceae bacterium]|nr:YbhN family protein [Vicinamibacteraceae bacterium]
MSARPLRRLAPLILKVVVSVGLLALLFTQTDVATLWARIRTADPRWLLGALALYGLMILLSTWRWQMLLDTQEVRAPFRFLTASFLVATYFNNFLPSNIGGDVVRIADSARLTGSKTVAGAVVLIDRALGLVALLTVAAAGAALGSRVGVNLPGLEYLWLVAGGAILLGVPLLFMPRLIPGLITPFVRLRPGLLEPRVARLEGTLQRMSRHPIEAGFVFLGGLGVQFLLVAFYMAVARALGAPLPWLAAFVVVPVSFLVQMAPVSMNGFGVREAVFGFFFAQLGLGVDAGLALSLIGQGLIILFSLSGGLVFLFRRHHQH